MVALQNINRFSPLHHGNFDLSTCNTPGLKGRFSRYYGKSFLPFAWFPLPYLQREPGERLKGVNFWQLQNNHHHFRPNKVIKTMKTCIEQQKDFQSQIE